MTEPTNVTLSVPLALQQLIKANNTLLQNYQAELMEQVQQANLQLMGILNINPADGWRLDIEHMVYRRIPAEEDQPTE